MTRTTTAPTRRILVHDPKPRRIDVPTFADRVVHQCLAAALEPRIERRMIADSFACRRGHGTHAALRKARAWARTYRWWVRLDVARFFPTIDHCLVREHLRRDVPHAALRALCERILAAAGTTDAPYVPGDDLFTPVGRRVGLPLGSLTSQLWANRYLDPVDHLAKDHLRVRAYLRYMDDMLVMHDDRGALVAIARRIEDACHGLRLRLHRWDVQPTAAGVGFVGFRIHRGQVRVRGSSVARARRRLRWQVRCAAGDVAKVLPGLRAVFGHWGHADSWRLRERTLRELGLFAGDEAPPTE